MKTLQAINRWIDPFAPLLFLICAAVCGLRGNLEAWAGFICATCYAAHAYVSTPDQKP